MILPPMETLWQLPAWPIYLKRNRKLEKKQNKTVQNVPEQITNAFSLSYAHASV